MARMTREESLGDRSSTGRSLGALRQPRDDRRLKVDRALRRAMDPATAGIQLSSGGALDPPYAATRRFCLTSEAVERLLERAPFRFGLTD